MSAKMMTATKDMEAIVGGYHGDPFAVLGPHQVEDGLVVRAFLPQAVEVDLALRKGTAVYDRIPMRRVHDAGFYEVFLPDLESDSEYCFSVKTGSAPEGILCEDPYAFPSLLSDFDDYLLAEGTHQRVYDYLGAHLREINGRMGVLFAVWAPSALRVSVIGDFNQWDGRRNPMRFHPGSGVWEIFLPGLHEGILYKYEIKSRFNDYLAVKSDPVGFAAEMRPKTASLVWNLDKYEWKDAAWIEQRAKRNSLDAPISIYEVHLGSWRRKNDWKWLTYGELSQELIPYVKERGYTHIELLPVAEHPLDASWGYQVTGYFAPTSRYGTPDEFMAFVDACHQAEVGVILDWVPAHFPSDDHGLSFFDGTHLYEHADPRQGRQPDWGTLVFNFGRHEVRQFLINNALFWLDKYHIDGLRVDAVASMLYLDFSRKQDEWVPNRYGGRENIEAIAFIRALNERVHERYPGVLTIAEESTAWPGVTAPPNEGGLGFDLKWNMGWMHDTLRYISNDPIHRAYHQGTLTFSLLYAFDEKFLLPFSHDEVVHLKRSMLDKMPGDLWQRFANLRLLYAYQWAHPGKKLLFMGGEFGQWREWSEARGLDWHLLDAEVEPNAAFHRGLQSFVRALNQQYATTTPLYEDDFSWDGFFWLDFRDSQRSIIAFGRRASSTNEALLVVCNFTPMVRHQYRLGVPEAGAYREVLNSDHEMFGGSGVKNEGVLFSSPTPWQDQPHSIELTLPPLAAVYLSKAAGKDA
ncbi:MAG: 1,4-alpha-glucan branching protein GlgB [Anaerolineae bacterium]